MIFKNLFKNKKNTNRISKEEFRKKLFLLLRSFAVFYSVCMIIFVIFLKYFLWKTMSVNLSISTISFQHIKNMDSMLIQILCETGLIITDFTTNLFFRILPMFFILLPIGKRLHDIGQKDWSFIIVLGFFIYINIFLIFLSVICVALCFLNGDKKKNRYGAVPKSIHF